MHIDILGCYPTSSLDKVILIIFKLQEIKLQEGEKTGLEPAVDAVASPCPPAHSHLPQHLCRMCRNACILSH